MPPGYVDAHRKTTGVVYTDEEANFTNLGGQTVVRWISYCKIGESSERFPHAGHGMDRNAKRPASFMKKKVSHEHPFASGSAPPSQSGRQSSYSHPFVSSQNARQYAAQCAVEYLMKHEHMPNDGENVVFARPTVSASSNANSPAPSSQDRTPLPHSGGGVPVSSPPGEPDPLQVAQQLHAGSAMDTTPDGPTAAQQVAQICGHLGIVPPSYQLQKHPDLEGVWSGYAAFSDPRLPQRLGEVQEVYSKRLVKETIAADVLQWLRRLEDARRKVADGTMDVSADSAGAADSVMS